MLLPKYFLLRVAAAYLGALPVTETSCVTQPFRSENSHPTKICNLHSSEGIAAIVNKNSWNARRAVILSINNKFYIYRMVNKNYLGCWPREGNVKNSN